MIDGCGHAAAELSLCGIIRRKPAPSVVGTFLWSTMVGEGLATGIVPREDIVLDIMFIINLHNKSYVRTYVVVCKYDLTSPVTGFQCSYPLTPRPPP